MSWPGSNLVLPRGAHGPEDVPFHMHITSMLSTNLQLAVRWRDQTNKKHPRQPHHKWTEEEDDMLRELREAGETWAGIAEILEVSTRQVETRMSRLGLSKGRGRPRGRKMITDGGDLW